MDIALIGDVTALMIDLTHVWPGVQRIIPSIIPQIPRPLTTTGFPLPRFSGGRFTVDGREPSTKRPRLADGSIPVCPICLEDVTSAWMCLPCGHRMHRVCAYGLLTLPALGSGGMMRCPMCRDTIDRYDLQEMGLDVSPPQLQRIAVRCNAVRALGSGGGMDSRMQPNYAAVARLVRQSSGARASDGFVYNTVLLAIERAIFHRKGLVRGLADQLAVRQTPLDTITFIDGVIKSHVDVLIGAAHAVVTDEDYYDDDHNENV